MRRISLPSDVLARLTQLAASDRDETTGLTVVDRDLPARASAVADWDTAGPARIVDAGLAGRSRRAVVAGLALAFPANAPDLALPETIRALYAPAFRRLVEGLASGDPYDDDAFAKDVRFVLGLSAPAGAQDVDLAWRGDLVGAAGRARRAVAGLGRLALARDVRGAAALLDAGPARPWLQIHTDARRLEDFHPEGWDACYRRIADLLALHPGYAGMVGLSWFYDPAVAAISPRLAYLQGRPLDNGAVRIRMGAKPIDVERATLTSDTRRALYEAGVYRPRCWAVYWPRQALLDWAARAAPNVVRLRRAA